MPSDMDPGLLQDFLTEATELIEQLDSDLVKLESASPGEEAAELCNGIFRALHTVKGAAGFLGLDNVTRFAHAAEDALNRLRKGEVAVTPGVIDVLLQGADVLRGMVEALAAGDDAPPCPEDLLEQLREIATGEAAGDEAPSDAAAPAAEADAGPGRPLELPEQKLDLISFMTTDLRDSAAQMSQCVEQAGAAHERADAANHLTELIEALRRTAEFFELEGLTRLIDLAGQAVPPLPDADDAAAGELLVRLGAIRLLIEQQADALDQQRALDWPLDTLAERIASLAAGEALPEAVAGAHDRDPARVLELDAVVAASASPGAPAEAEASLAPDADEPAPEVAERRTGNDRRSGADRRAAATEKTIRVEVGRLESLLNLVGQMVLTKNRVLALTKKLQLENLSQEVTEEAIGAANDLDRLTGNLQVGVMRTRMQPLAKLFDRYPRVIRDIARATEKQIDLQIDGKETEVDKSVLELLADPLVHILRNSADHGIEPADQRTQAGKPQRGTLRLAAEHQGSHVRIAISDDGKGMDRRVIAAKAVERGLVSADKVESLSDQEVLQFIFAAGFSTAEQVSDLSGRGVGMDVVRTNVSKMNGSINVDSEPGKGTTIEILIPLTVAIMPAMVVGVAAQSYCIPLQSISEIIRPDAREVHYVQGQPTIRLRDEVLPLIDLRQRLGEPADEPARFAVVVAVGGHKAGLMVDRLVGQQDIVIKPLDDATVQGGPFSGATIQEDGDVSLILDVVQLLRSTGSGPHQRAA
ncbi:MAG: chemotaxis protein CheA [Phycisphaeraceae bacterium]